MRAMILWLVLGIGTAAQPEASGAAAVAEALVRHRLMPPSERTASLPADVQKELARYRQREASFKSSLIAPRGGGGDERSIHAQREAIERVVFALFPRRDSANVAASFALDADLDQEAAFIDELQRDLSVPWLAPYLNLIAGHRKACDGRLEGGRLQLARARDAGHPLIRVAAEELLTSVRWCSPSP